MFMLSMVPSHGPTHMPSVWLLVIANDYLIKWTQTHMAYFKFAVNAST